MLRLRSRLLAAIVLITAAAGAYGQTATLLKDVNTLAFANASSFPAEFTGLAGGPTLFVARVPSGVQLFRTLGTAPTTAPVNSAYPQPTSLYVFQGSRALFSFLEPNRFRGLAITDGTSGGTTTLLTGCDPSDFMTVGNRVVFWNQRASAAWSTDGTAAGTVQLAPSSLRISRPIGVHNGRVFLSAANAQVYTTDGTPAGTTLFTTLGTVPESQVGMASTGTGFVILTDARGTTKVWGSDGTPGGTTLVATIPARYAPGIVSLGSRAYFRCNDTLYSSDGTAAGTGPVPGAPLEPRGLTRVGSRLLFAGRTAANGSEPYAIDSFQTVTMLADIDPGTPGAFDAGLPTFTTNGTIAYFAPRGTSLWVTDGTPNGTRSVWTATAPDAISSPVVTNGRIWMAGSDPIAGSEPWVSDGTAANTMRIVDLATQPSSSTGTSHSRPSEFTNFGSLTLFSADDGILGRELWATDGTPSGTRLLADVVPGRVSGDPMDITPAGDRAFFVGREHELYVTDGKPSGTKLVQSYASNAEISTLSASGRNAYFALENNRRIGDIWFSDGTPAGTRQVTNAQLREVRTIVPCGQNGLLFFAMSSQAPAGQEPWITDGTAAGTHPLGDLRPGFQSSYLDAVGWRGLAYFATFDGTNVAVWVTDGTLGGTTTLQQLGVATKSSPRVDFLPTMDGLFLIADYAASNGEIWFLKRGTTSFQQLKTGVRSLGVTAAVGPAGLFSVDGDVWVSDGTQAGTRAITTGANRFVPYTLSGNRFAWFVGSDSTAGSEPWVLDLTTGIARRAFDLNAGPNSSFISPPEFVHNAGHVICDALTPASGFEPWALDTGASVAVVDDGNAALDRPGLWMTDPIVGQTAQLSVHGATSGAVVHTFINLGRTAPVVVAPSWFVHVPLVGIAPLPAFRESATLTLPIPAGTIGIDGTIQAVVAPGVSPLGSDLTNALHFRIGS